MKILHVSLGNPYTIQGGLNQYCKDLIETQKHLGHEVSLVYPGRITLNRKVSFFERSSHIYELENSLPVALNHGISNPGRFFKKADKCIFTKFLKEVSPDIIHVHSIQGFYLEFFEAAQDLSIPLVYTTHDYYPICPKVTLYNGAICSGPSPGKCWECNKDCGISPIADAIRKTNIYQNLKKHPLLAQVKNKALLLKPKESSVENNNPEEKKSEFQKLFDYNSQIMSKMNLILANSPQTKDIFSSYFPENNIQNFPVDINKSSKVLHQRTDPNFLSVGYLGGDSEFKGFKTIQNLIQDMPKIPGFYLYIYGDLSRDRLDIKENKRVYIKGYFSSSEEESVWNNIDVLLVPSVWYETFGLVVLEALRRNIPVIASDLVGSNYLLENLKIDLVYPYDSLDELEEKIKNLIDINYYNQIQEKIKDLKFSKCFENHVIELLEIYGSKIQE